MTELGERTFGMANVTALSLPDEREVDEGYCTSYEVRLRRGEAGSSAWLSRAARRSWHIGSVSWRSLRERASAASMWQTSPGVSAPSVLSVSSWAEGSGFWSVGGFFLLYFIRRVPIVKA